MNSVWDDEFANFVEGMEAQMLKLHGMDAKTIGRNNGIVISNRETYRKGVVYLYEYHNVINSIIIYQADQSINLSIHPCMQQTIDPYTDGTTLLPNHLAIDLSTNLFNEPPIHLSIHATYHPSNYSFILPSNQPPIHESIYKSNPPSIYKPTHPWKHPFIKPTTHLSIHFLIHLTKYP